MYKKYIYIIYAITFIFTSIGLLFTYPIISSFVNAATLTPLSDTLSVSGGYGTSGPEAAGSTGVSHTITYTSPALSSGGTITIYIQTGSTIGGGECNCGFSSVAVLSSATTTENGTTIATSSNYVIATNVTDPNYPDYTFTSVTITTTAAIPAGASIVITGITATNPSTITSSTNQYLVDVTDSNGDDGSLAIPIITNGSVTVTGVVPPTITFGLSSNSTSFGVMQIGTVNTSTPATTLTFSTNAKSGGEISVYDKGNGTTAGMYSSLDNHTIPSSTATLAAGTEGYGINAAVTSTNGTGGVVGSLTIQSPYNGTGDSVGGLSTTSQELASTSSPLYLVTTQVNYLAAISVTTPSGVYQDQVTYIATGNF